MLFNSAAFLLFLPCVLAVYHLCPRGWKSPVLLAASYAFYAGWDLRFVSLLILSTLLDFFIARAMRGAGRERKHRLLWASITVNLGILATFKYLGFFVDQARALLSTLGLQALDGVALDIVLPLGISFFTLQTMAYTIDVYRGDQEPCDDLIDYAVFVAYFPQLVAGPIERASRLLPQIQAHPVPTPAVVRSGLALILLGMFKKVVVGDALLAPYVAEAFGSPASQSPAFLFVCAFLFSLELYVDFSGYSDIARGTSRLLGIELMVNFSQPLLSVDIAELWRRWHISLSTWLRDYLYIPLGGNRQGALATYRNLLLTMLLGGLWHGASWNFVIWGGLHGLFLAVHRARDRSGRPARSGTRPWWRVALGVVGTNFLFAAALVFFRSNDLQTAIEYFAGISLLATGWRSCVLAFVGLLAFFVVLLALDLGPRLAGVDEAVERLPAWARSPIHALTLFCIWVAWPADEAPFIYFQF